MLILRSASARDETTGWGQPLSQHWLGTVLCWAHSGDTAYRGTLCIYWPLPSLARYLHIYTPSVFRLQCPRRVWSHQLWEDFLAAGGQNKFHFYAARWNFLTTSTCCRSRDVPEFQGLVIINKHLLIGTKPTTFYSFITPALHSHSYPPLEPCFCIEPLLNFTSVSSRGWIFPSMNEFKLYVAHLTVKLCPSFLCISGANFPTQKGWKRRHNEQNNTECTSGMLQSTVRLKYANLEQWNFCLAVNSPASFTLSGSTACPHIPGTITHHTAHWEIIIPKSKLDTTKKWCVVRAF